MNKITASNLPNLGVEPELEYYGDGSIRKAEYWISSSSDTSRKDRVAIYFSINSGTPFSILFNGCSLPANSYLEVREDGKLYIII